MTIEFGILSVLLLFGVFHGFFLVATLVFHQHRGQANRLLALLIFVFTLGLMHAAIVYSNLIFQIPQVYTMTGPLVYLIGPLYYFYARALLKGHLNFRWFHPFHLIPAFALMAYLWGWYMVDPAIKIRYLTHLKQNPVFHVDVQSFIIMLAPFAHQAVYLLFTYRLVCQVRESYQKVASDTLTAIRLDWLNRFVRGYLLFLIVYVCAFSVIAYLDVYWYKFDYLVRLCQSCFIHALGYVAIRQPELLSGSVSKLKEKYQTSTLSENESQELGRRLKALMETEKPFLNNTLKLTELAERLNTSTHHVSQAINQEFGKNFFDFVNGYRVQEAQQLLVDKNYQNLTILAITYEAGFNNKVTFNQMFKKLTGQTPSAYRRQKLAS